MATKFSIGTGEAKFVLTDRTTKLQTAGTFNEIDELKDVSITNLADKHILKYNSDTGFWENKDIGDVTGIEWGNIVGTLSDQTDLQGELDSKEDTLTFSTGLSRTDDTITTNDSQIDHNSLNNYDSDEHIDWTISQTENIHEDNYTDTTYESSDFDHDSLTNTHNLTTDIDHNQLTNYSSDEHRVIDDASTSTTSLWSSDKINSELDNYIPYTGATSNVDLGSQDLTTVGNIFGNSFEAGASFFSENYLLVDNGLDLNVDSKYADFNDLDVTTTGQIEGGNFVSSGSIKLQADKDVDWGEIVNALWLGAGDDAWIGYDGLDLHIKPNEVGSGHLKIGGTTEVTSGNFKVSGTDAKVSLGDASATGDYALAYGCKGSGSETLEASGEGALAGGIADDVGGSGGPQILSSGNAAIALGYVRDGAEIKSSGYGSVAIGYGESSETLEATADNSFALGRNFSNSTANSFAIGFGQKDFEVKSGVINFPNDANLNAGSGNITTTGQIEGGELEIDTNLIKTDSSNEWVGIKESSPTHPLDIVGSETNGALQIRLSNITTDGESKTFGFTGRHHNNSEEDVIILVGQSRENDFSENETVFFWGGGSTDFNAATEQNFYIAPDDTTGAGTNHIKLQLNNDGVHIPQDDTKLLFGGEDDAGIWYDGLDLHIDAQLVGSGNIILENLPTSDPELSGGVWRDGNDLKISTG
ncbi:MAG: hypothetical protein ACOC5T_01690 [Elusimicrobiota bacterium]